MFTRLDYSSALEYSIIRRYTNIVYRAVACGVARGESAPPPGISSLKKIVLKYSAYSLVDTLIVDIVDNVW